MINKHPEPELLLEYASGSLPLAPSIAVGTHLHYCNRCGSSVQALEHLGGAMLEDTCAESVAPDLLDKVMLRLDQGEAERAPEPTRASATVDKIGHELPEYVQQLLPIGALEWKFLSPSLRVANLTVGEATYEVALHRIRAGGKAPEHNHSGQEITVVLKGSFSDEDGVYLPGDFVMRDKGDVHRPFSAQNEECICLSVLASPIRLTGLKRLINPFLKFTPG